MLYASLYDVKEVIVIAIVSLDDKVDMCFCDISFLQTVNLHVYHYNVKIYNMFSLSY